jgi:hypothetical protein
MRVRDPNFALTRIGAYERHAAMTKPKMCDLDDRGDAGPRMARHYIITTLIAKAPRLLEMRTGAGRSRGASATSSTSSRFRQGPIFGIGYTDRSYQNSLALDRTTLRITSAIPSVHG